MSARVTTRALLRAEVRGIKRRNRWRVKKGNDRALLRAEVKGIKRRNMWRVGIASFWRHFDRGKKKKKLKKKAAVKTASRTRA
jgi:hypothetical protein